MIFHENRLPADDSREISYLIFFFFLKSGKICNCRLLQITGGALKVNPSLWDWPSFGVYIIYPCFDIFLDT